MRVLSAALLLAACDSCTPLPPPDPGPQPSPTVVPDAGPDQGPAPVDGTACERAGARLEELQCRAPDGRPRWQTPDGVPFGEACAVAADDGRDWHPECLAAIADCGEVEAAFRGELCR